MVLRRLAIMAGTQRVMRGVGAKGFAGGFASGFAGLVMGDSCQIKVYAV